MDNNELRKLLEKARLEHLKGNQHAFDPVFKYCYKFYKNRCINEPGFEAAFLDAMYKTWKHFIIKRKTANQPANYISRIIKNTWTNHQKKGGKNKPLNLKDEIIDYLNNKKNKDENDPIINIENRKNKDYNYEKRFWALAVAYLELGDCCQEILMKLYYEGKKLKDLIGICGLKNYDTLKSKASQCRKKWKNLGNNLLDD